VLVSGAGSGAAYDPDPWFADPTDEAACRRTLESVLSEAFRDAQPDVLDDVAGWRTREDADRAAFDAQIAALDGWDAEPLYEVDNEALGVDGDADPLRDPGAGAALAEGLPRATHEVFDDASHFVHVERSRPVNDAILAFLTGDGE
jgi:pimeloyl-ACP methyl ester carboxylesterase